MSHNVRPFPFASLESVSKREVALGNVVRALARRHLRLEALGRELTAACGEGVTVGLRGVAIATASRAADSACALALAPADASSIGDGAVIVAELALAARVVAGALKRDAPRVSDASRPSAPALAGALAAVAIATARRAHTGHPLRVLAAGPAPPIARDLVSRVGEVAELRLSVTVGPDVFDAAVLLPTAHLHAVASATLDDGALEALGPLPLELAVVISTATATHAEIEALAVGDAWLPGDISLAPTGDGALEGRVQLIAPTAEVGLGGKLVEGAKVVVGAMERSSWSADDAGPGPASTEEPMAEDTSAAARVLEDAPVVVRVEIGAARMTAREWSAISEGDVVTLDRRITDPVSLRVGGVEIARGELVHIEGELGVRVTSRVMEPS
jgi:flagellar motor switch protein FliN